MLQFALYTMVLILGLASAIVYGQKTKGFRLSEYVLLFILPLGYVLWLTPTNPDVLLVFLIFCVGGPIVEWVIGFAYHRTIGERLWTYKRLSITGYTSWLVMPLWGIGGVFFYFLGRILVG